MRYIRPFLRFKNNLFLLLLTALAATPVFAQSSNFGTIRLSPGFNTGDGTVTGHTGGSYSLSAIAKRDRNGKACIGFGDTAPDHIMILQKDFSNLRIQVNSGGADTTLVIQGSNDGNIICGDDTGKNKDASVDAKNWKAGTYRIWVGIFNAGNRQNYTLSVRE